MCVLYEVWSNQGEPTEQCIHTTFSYYDAIKQMVKAEQKYDNVELYVFDGEVTWRGDKSNYVSV